MDSVCVDFSLQALRVTGHDQSVAVHYDKSSNISDPKFSNTSLNLNDQKFVGVLITKTRRFIKKFEGSK